MKSLKILVVEDDVITANAIQESLTKAGHFITAIARNYREIKSSFNNELPDIILMDISLEGSAEDGITIGKALLKEHPVPIIYLTAHSENSMLQRARETRPAAYLLKPFRHKELAIQVELAYYNHKSSLEDAIDPFTSEDLFLPVDQGKGYVKIMKSDVQYMSASGSYVEVYSLTSHKPLIFSMNLGYLSQFFLTPPFLRLGRSLFVNLNQIVRIEKQQLFVFGRKDPVDYPENLYKELIQKFARVKTPR